MSEDPALRLKRLGMRAWRRGMKECDLILGGFADARLAAMPAAEIDAFEALLEEPDQQILAWVTGAEPPPPEHETVTAALRAFFDDAQRGRT